MCYDDFVRTFLYSFLFFLLSFSPFIFLLTILSFAFRYSQSPKNYHLPLISTVIRTPLSTDQTQSGSIPSSYFTNCILRCEELEQILKEMPKTRSHILPEEGSSQFPHTLAELPKMLTKFVAVLPAVPSWTKLRLPAVEADARDSDPQAAVCNARLERPDAKYTPPAFKR
jgi:hypothetical protein